MGAGVYVRSAVVVIVGVAAVAVGGSADFLHALAPGSTVDIHCKGRAHMTEETDWGRSGYYADSVTDGTEEAQG